MSMTAKEILENAKKLLVEKGWTQEHYARDEDGCAVETVDVAQTPETAACFCAYGALVAASRNDNFAWVGGRGSQMLKGEQYRAHVAVLDALPGARTATDVTQWNDRPERTKEEVLALFDRAIALTETKEEAQ